MGRIQEELDQMERWVTKEDGGQVMTARAGVLWRVRGM
jgi:hypothetical protein